MKWLSRLFRRPAPISTVQFDGEDDPHKYDEWNAIKASMKNPNVGKSSVECQFPPCAPDDYRPMSMHISDGLRLSSVRAKGGFGYLNKEGKMMHNDSAAILEDLLSRWHHWMKGKPVNGVDRLDDPAFRNARSRSGWDSSDDVLDAELHSFTMQAIDFHVSGDGRGQGGMPEPYRAAIYILARNCYTGAKVWLNPRLPKDPEERGIVLMEARNLLTRRLISAGVM